MWHNTRRGHNLIRKRYTTRKFRLNLVNICIIITCICVTTLSIVGINKLLNNNKNILANGDDVQSEDSYVEIYNEVGVENNSKKFKLTFLGELMMGGKIGLNLSYNYMSAFKSISSYTKEADYTVLNLATNIIDLKELNNTTSKYIVTKQIENAFYALGIDGINVATDHMLDFGKDIFNDTITILKEEYDLIGLKNQTIYAEHNGIKVAIIGVLNEVIGSESQYTNAGIMMYNMKKIKSMITEAKKNVNTVIMLTHLGLENNHEITNVMSWFYKELINAGADIVLGSHAIGVYPIEIYKGKPIIYSMGYLMHDTDYIVGKKSGIFNLQINEQGKLESIEIIPLYINAKKQTLLYEEYNKSECKEFLNYLSSKLNKKQYSIVDNKLKVELDK